ncbi:MAG TPA: hypothetical protein VE968_04020 [Sphingomicrobium sp.]|nr:hypothetical protein [Sphingomicrobium sp.]
MSLVERVDVLVAIVLGLALAELGTSFHRLMRAGKRVKWDWMSPALAFLMLLEVVQFWWISQSWYANATELRLLEFLPRLLLLLLIYLLAAAVLPDEVQEDGVDLRAFYVETSRYFWALIVVLTAFIMIFVVPANSQSDYLGGVIRHELVDCIALVIAAVALLVRNIRAQQAVVISLLALTGWIYLVSGRGFH